MGESYTIGMDYGTLSGRGVLVRCSDGEVVASAVKDYTHGVMEVCLPDGRTKLPPNWSLEYPGDYLEVLESVIPALLQKSGIEKEDIIGIGIDFTSCTVLPVDAEGIPLCMKEEYRDRRNAYAKLWKHHGAQAQADRVNALLAKWGWMDEPRFGGKISPELLIPKVMETLEEDPEIYAAAAELLEAGDWLTRVLTGSHKRSCSMAGYKAWWNGETGYPEKEFLRQLDERMENLAEEKLGAGVCGIGEAIGTLSESWAERLGLKPGIAVAPAVIDSHAGFPGSGISRKGQMMLVLGTSSVMLTLSEKPYSGKGVCGGVRDAIVPGFYALESGLASVGDLFRWFVENFVPVGYDKEAKDRNMDIHELLSEKAKELEPGESGLLALDWWNGNKTPFVDGNLQGALIGMNLNTRPEEIYRALIEATAFGTRMIKELFEEAGVEIQEVIASGGIASKNPFLMQVYADVLGVNIRLAASDQAAALGAAVYAALSAGAKKGGYDSYAEAVQHMSRTKEQMYTCDTRRKEKYDRLYEFYQSFGRLMGETKRDLLSGLYRMKTMERKAKEKVDSNGTK